MCAYVATDRCERGKRGRAYFHEESSESLKLYYHANSIQLLNEWIYEGEKPGIELEQKVAFQTCRL